MQTTHTRTMTEGNIYGHLFHLFLPLIFGNILQQFYNTIDALVIARYAGNEEFAAIGIAGTVMNLFLFIIVGSCTGLSVLFARNYGTEDYKSLRKQHFISLIFGGILVLFLCVCGFLGMNGILRLIHTPANLMQYTSTYLWWIFLSLPAAFLYNMYAAALRSSGDTVVALLILAASVFSNLLLDIFLVAHMGMGIKGAALATAFTQIISAVLCLCYLFHAHPEFVLQKEDCRFDKRLLNTTFRCSMVTALHQASLYIGKMLVQGTINTGGTEIISSYTAATRIEGFTNSFSDSGSAATSVLVSQNYSVGDSARTRDSFRCSLRFTFILGTLCAIILYFSAPVTVKAMLGNAASHPVMAKSGITYLQLISFFYPLCYTGGTFTGTYNGVGKMVLTLIGSTLQISLRVILTWFFFPYFGLAATAIATGIGWLSANIFWLICLLILRHFNFR